MRCRRAEQRLFRVPRADQGQLVTEFPRNSADGGAALALLHAMSRGDAATVPQRERVPLNGRWPCVY